MAPIAPARIDKAICSGETVCEDEVNILNFQLGRAGAPADCYSPGGSCNITKYPLVSPTIHAKVMALLASPPPTRPPVPLPGAGGPPPPAASPPPAAPPTPAGPAGPGALNRFLSRYSFSTFGLGVGPLLGPRIDGTGIQTGGGACNTSSEMPSTCNVNEASTLTSPIRARIVAEVGLHTDQSENGLYGALSLLGEYWNGGRINNSDPLPSADGAGLHIRGNLGGQFGDVDNTFQVSGFVSVGGRTLIGADPFKGTGKVVTPMSGAIGNDKFWHMPVDIGVRAAWFPGDWGIFAEYAYSLRRNEGLEPANTDAAKDRPGMSPGFSVGIVIR